MVAGARHGGSEARGWSCINNSVQLKERASGCDYALDGRRGPTTVGPGGARCSPGRLLTLGWLLLADLQATCGANDTAVQDPGLAREGACADQGQGEGGTRNFREADPEGRAEAGEGGEGGEGGRHPGGLRRHQWEAKP
ncbi:Sperm Acrosome Membrane-Associated Protein 1 [Manis pentadactyla]|nr:Sperm Acrosome Membrane-Associated Protein 1 [Manis pentadactyla]